MGVTSVGEITGHASAHHWETGIDLVNEFPAVVPVVLWFFAESTLFVFCIRRVVAVRVTFSSIKERRSQVGVNIVGSSLEGYHLRVGKLRQLRNDLNAGRAVPKYCDCFVGVVVTVVP